VGFTVFVEGYTSVEFGYALPRAVECARARRRAPLQGGFMRSKVLRIGSMSFALAMLVATVAPVAFAADEGTDGEEAPKKKKKKKAEEGTGEEATPKPEKAEGEDGEAEQPKKKKKKKAEGEDGEAEEAKPKPAPAVDETAGLKEVGPDSYAATSPLGRVKIDRELPTEVGKWGWTWFGDSDVLSGLVSPTGGGTPSFKMSNVGVRNWFSPKMGWEAGLGLTVNKAAGDGAPTLYCAGLNGGILYSLARYEYVNVFAAGRLALVPFCNPIGKSTNAAGDSVEGPSVFQLGLSGEVAVEIFLDAFQLFHSGPMLKTSRSISITLGSGLSIRYTKYGDTKTTLAATGETTSVSNGSNMNISTTGVVSGSSSVFGTPTGSVALTYYF
jgi:hypothetical protein